MALPELPRARGRERVVPTWELVFGTLTQVLSLLLNWPGLLGIVDCARYVREETCGPGGRSRTGTRGRWIQAFHTR